MAFSENLNFKLTLFYFFSVDEDYYYALRPQGLDSDSEPDPDEATQLLDYRWAFLKFRCYDKAAKFEKNLLSSIKTSGRLSQFLSPFQKAEPDFIQGSQNSTSD